MGGHPPPGRRRHVQLPRNFPGIGTMRYAGELGRGIGPGNCAGELGRGIGFGRVSMV